VSKFRGGKRKRKNGARYLIRVTIKGRVGEVDAEISGRTVEGEEKRADEKNDFRLIYNAPARGKKRKDWGVGEVASGCRPGPRE